MGKYSIFIHGVPIGHEICGSTQQEEQEFLQQFYNLKTNQSVLMQTDMTANRSYYTYLRKNNFSNAEGRPGSYFGITVGIDHEYCANVSKLYSILDTIYNRICVNNLVRESSNGSSFLVREISSAQYNGTLLVDIIKTNIEKNLSGLFLNALPVISGNPYNRSVAYFNTEEVDSPAFVQALLSKRVIISPEINPSSVEITELRAKINPLEALSKKLIAENKQLQEECNQNKNENQRVGKELSELKQNGNIAYKKELDTLKRDLDQAMGENEVLRKRVNEINRTLAAIEEPLSKIRQTPTPNGKNQVHSPQRSSENSIKAWLPYINTGILVLVLFISFLVYTSIGDEPATTENPEWTAAPAEEPNSERTNTPDNNTNSKNTENDWGMEPTGPQENMEDDNPSSLREKSQEQERTPMEEIIESHGNDEESFEDLYEDCTIDILNFNKKAGFDKKKAYKLSIKSKGKGKLPQGGQWKTTYGNIDSHGNLVFPQDIQSGTMVVITYTCKNKVISRTEKIK